MSLKERIKAGLKEREKSRNFQRSVDKKAMAIRRKAYMEESKRQAAIKGKQLAIQKANKPSFSQRIAGVVTPQPVSRTPIRRVVRRRTTTKRKPKSRRKSKSRRVVRKKKERRSAVAPTVNWGY